MDGLIDSTAAAAAASAAAGLCLAAVLLNRRSVCFGCLAVRLVCALCLTQLKFIC